MVRDRATAVVYRKVGAIDLYAHVFTPPASAAGAGPKPALLFFHGGNLTGGSPEEFYPEAEFFATRGMVAVSASYRLFPNQATRVGDCIADAQAAVAWLRTRPDVDAARVVACGYSAGGMIAAATALIDPVGAFDARCRPDALMLLSATFDTTWYRPTVARRAENGNLPPTLLLHGNRDTMAPVHRARQFASAMAAAGNRCELAEFDGAHTFFRPIGRNGIDGFTGVLGRMDAFLTERGYLVEDPSAPSRIHDLGTAMLAGALARRKKRTPKESSG